MKVGKKTPLTLAHFGEFFKLLPARGDSSDSWTVNFAARLQQALEEARPHREKAAEFFTQAKALEVSVNSPTRKQNWTQDVFRFAASRVRALFSLSRNDAVGLGERARLARTGRRPADQPGWQLPAPFSCTSRASEALGGTPRAEPRRSRSRSQSHRASLAVRMQSEKGSAIVPVALFGVSPNGWCGRFHSPYGAPMRVLPARRRDADESGRDDRAPHLQLHRSGLGVISAKPVL